MKIFKNAYIVEYGSNYSDDAWDILCVCSTEEKAKEFIESDLVAHEYRSRRLYHIIGAPYFD